MPRMRMTPYHPLYAQMNPYAPIPALGMENPAAAIFSLVSLAQHVYFLVEFRRKTAAVRKHSSDAATLVTHWQVYSIMWMITYVSSFLFHRHDTKVTEAMDYIGVFCAAAWMLYTMVLRVLRVERGVYQLCIAVPFLYHVLSFSHFMLYVKFDYGYHMWMVIYMTAGVFLLGVALALIERRKYIMYILGSFFVMGCAAPFEMIDFVPVWQVFDGHSLWHGCAPAIAYLFYQFYLHDTLDVYRRAKRSIHIDTL